MRKDPDEHLLATDVGRDDDLILERSFAASPRGLKTRAIGTGAAIPASPSGPCPIGLGRPGTVTAFLRRSSDLGYTPDLDLLAADPD